MKKYILIALVCAGLMPSDMFAQGSVATGVTDNFDGRVRELDPVVPGFEEAAPTFIKTGQAGFAFLSIPTDARTAALGGAGVGLIGSGSAILYNPGALAFMEGREAHFTYVDWLVDTKSLVAGVAVNMPGRGTFGLSIVNFDAGTINSTSIDDNPASQGFKDDGPLTTSNYAISAAYGLKITDRFSAGATLRLAHQDLGTGNIFLGASRQTVENSKNAFAFDLGTYFNTGFRNTVMAMSVQNFSTEVVYQREQFELPRNIRLGLLIDVISMMGNTPVPHHLDLALDVNNPIDFDERIHIGAEYTYRAAGSSVGFTLRGGYKTNHDTESFSAGGGLQFKTEGGQGVRVDYAFKQFDSFFFSAVHILSAAVTF